MYFSFAMFIFPLALLQAFCIKVGTLAIFLCVLILLCSFFLGIFLIAHLFFKCPGYHLCFLFISTYIVRGLEIDQSVSLLESENTLCVLNTELGTQDFVLVTFPHARKYFRQ